MNYDIYPKDPKIQVVVTYNKLGRNFDIELFEYLPPPKKVENKYSIKYIYSNKNALKKINYPPYDNTG